MNDQKSNIIWVPSKFKMEDGCIVSDCSCPICHQGDSKTDNFHYIQCEYFNHNNYWNICNICFELICAKGKVEDNYWYVSYNDFLGFCHERNK